MDFIIDYAIKEIWLVGTFIGLILYGYKSRTEKVDPLVAFLVSFFFSWFFVAWAIGQVIFDFKNKDKE